MLRTRKKLEEDENEVFQEDNLILDTVYTLSHIRDIDGEDIPAYCFLHEITDTFGMSDNDAIDIVTKNGYKIMKVFGNEEVDGGLIVADKECSPEMIKKDYERFYGVDVKVDDYKGQGGPKYESVVKEDTVKVKDGKWTNKGKEGTHGTFKTKKEADAQRKAMFANHYHEDVNSKAPWDYDWYRQYDSKHEVFDTDLQYGGGKDFTWLGSKEYLENMNSGYELEPDNKIAKLKIKPCKLLFYNQSEEEWKQLCDKYGDLGDSDYFDVINPGTEEIKILNDEGFDGFYDGFVGGERVLYIKKDLVEVINDNVKFSEGEIKEGLDIKEVSTPNCLVLEDVEKHETLNPKLWNEDNTLKDEVREKILQIVKEFTDTLEDDEIKFKLDDIRLVGSNCSYNYNDKSDLDIHIIMDTKSLKCPDNLYPLLYSAYRSLFNKKFDIDFYDIPVEIFVETSDTKQMNDEVKESRQTTAVKSNGMYSVLKNEWIKEPIAEEIPEIDKNEFEKLYNKWEDKYFEVVESNDKDQIIDFIEDIYDLRKESIANDGEYGLGNLVFKEIRNLGYLDNLKDLKNEIISDELSLGNEKEQDTTMKGYEIDNTKVYDMDESSISRVRQHLVNEKPCAIISTYRTERSEQENYNLFKELKEIAKKKYGFIELVSRWSEENNEGEVESSDERALLIPNISYEEAMKLAQKYEQSSFIFKDEESCEEICSTPFTDYDGKSHQVGDVVRTFNTKADDRGMLNLKDAEDIFARRKGGPASHLVKGDNRSFHLKEVLEVVEPRASYFDKGRYYINILK